MTDATRTSQADQQADQREAWDRMAREDARFYVLSQGKPGETIPEHEFYRTGRELVEGVLDRDTVPQRRGLAVEIGCGVGRNLFALAGLFERAVGFDISPRMVELTNTHPVRPAGAEARVAKRPALDGIADRSADLVLSVIVFQHIPDWAVIENYIRETARVLAPGGLAALHFDTRHVRALRTAYMALPDRMLPSVHRRGMRRHPRDPGRVAAAIERAGLRINEQTGPGTAHHWFYCGRAEA